MVKPTANQHRHLIVLNALFAAVFASCAASGAYFTFVGQDQTRMEIRDFRGAIAKSRAELLNLKTERDRLSTLVAERQAVLSKGGILPAETPVERYFQDLSRLASEHHLQVLRQNPLSPRTYPGLLEQRYCFEVSGTMADIMFLLQSIENIEAWADVSFIKITDGKSRQEPGSDGRVALLTISIFSALGADTAEKGPS